ncbi:RND family transporter [Segniliparus rugosus]|uniref:Membrane transport protein MMPL domain-containing protein n=1 Tax=Segniliparus rugosus (strain ATCC BAA-974 / DSM 45345 / CCUG 50838 / CIP 108380 / JCM 13579 / CDC 945) TaxID=679197 RepID=E5XQR1_SEGRC|nr:MMPL family transporter [Segniliparus rugosus]EFV13322.1 hypothetical protein HMPREF9336_01833 [Segniliparus rugosus ATCC BAA-974]
MSDNNSTQQKRSLLAKVVRKGSVLVVLAWIAFAVVVNVIAPQIEPVTHDNQGPLVPLDAPSTKALVHIGKVFKESDSNTLAMIVIEGDHKLNQQDHEFYSRLVAELKKDKKHVQYIMDMWNRGFTAPGVQSSDGKASFTLVRAAGDMGSTLSDESSVAIRETVERMKPPPGTHVYVGGAAPLSSDMLKVGDESMNKMMFTTIIIITVMLLIVYRSIATLLLVLATVIIELVAGRGIVSSLAFYHYVGISTFASNILVSLILGAGTDYAIFLVGRYHEARHMGEDRETAYYSAVDGVTHVILGSGCAVAGATFCLHFTRLNYFSTMGIPCAVAMLTAVTAALTLGPALLSLGSHIGLFDPKTKHSQGVWRKVGVSVVRWPGRILVAGIAVVLIGSLTLPTYRPLYDDRYTVPEGTPARQALDAADRHYPVSKLNSDMFMVESDHDMRNSTDLIALDRIAKAIFHTPGIGMVQSITRPLGRPMEHSSFTYTMGSMGTKINEMIPFFDDLTGRFTEMSEITKRMVELTGLQRKLTQQQADSAHITAKVSKEMQEITNTMRDDMGYVDDYMRPFRNFFYWETYCYELPWCWMGRSLFDMMDQIDKMADLMPDTVKAATINDTVTPELVDVAGRMMQQLDQMNKVLLTEQSTMWPSLTQMKALGKQMQDLGRAFDESQNDEFFYMPPESFDSPDFQVGLYYLVSPDGKAARVIIFHDGEALTPEGIEHDKALMAAARESIKGTTLAGAKIYLGGSAATYWDISEGLKYDLLIAATAAFALIFLIMLLITRSVVAAFVIVGTVAFSFSGAFGLSVLVWQHFVHLPLSWLVLPITFIVLVAVGSDYNLLLISRCMEENHAGLNTGLIRAVASSGKVVTTAGLVFAATMAAMLSSDLKSIGQMGSTVALGLLLDTLVVRALVVPCIVRLLGPVFWWPRVVRQRPAAPTRADRLLGRS